MTERKQFAGHAPASETPKGPSNEKETDISVTKEAASQPHVQDDAAPRVEQAHHADEGSGRTLGPFLVDDRCHVVTAGSAMWLFSTFHDYGNALSLIEMVLKAIPPASETGRASAWQPISSAPKDGTQILVFVPPHEVTTTSWEDGTWGWPDHVFWSVEPTHWRLLPLAPSEDETTRTER